MFTLNRPRGPRYAFVVAGVIFVALLVSAGLRSAPGVLLVPLEREFGWSRDATSGAAAIGIFCYGLVGPFAAAVMQRFGVRRTLLGALLVMAAATAMSVWMTEVWHLVLTWGVLSGLASGCVAIVLGATVVNRWFVKRRGLMMGLLTASTATGTLVFLPGFAALVGSHGWQSVAWTMVCCCLALLPLVYLLLPERPADVGLLPYGADPATHINAVATQGNPLLTAIRTLGRASRSRDFWLLFATFFICGFTTNGLIGTHFIALCADQSIPEVRAASLLALMGIFDLVGTTASGWLTDRYDPRKLLFMYYALRGLSLAWLPHSDFSMTSLSIFAVFYGLDWIATVPPTMRLANDAFGERDAPIVFGWIVAGHQLGAASAAFFAGSMRNVQGNYLDAFFIAGLAGLIAAVIALLVRGRRGTHALAAASP